MKVVVKSGEKDRWYHKEIGKTFEVYDKKTFFEHYQVVGTIATIDSKDCVVIDESVKRITPDTKFNFKNARSIPKGYKARYFTDNVTFVVCVIQPLKEKRTSTGKVKYSKVGAPVATGFSLVNHDAGDEFNWEMGKHIAKERALDNLEVNNSKKTNSILIDWVKAREKNDAREAFIYGKNWRE